MLRRLIASNADTDSVGFRIRGKEVSRVEGLSDGVFALALTLLIVSVEVPREYAELMNAIKGLPVFACCFALLMWFWGCHYVFYRRYGLNDVTTIILNSVLLFLVLFYVYPMKYLFGLFLSRTTGVGPSAVVSLSELRGLFVLYAAGFAAIAGVFALMHLHAYRRGEQLELTPRERHLVRGSIVRNIVLIGIGVVSAVIALTAQGVWVTLAGFVYALVGVTEGVLASRFAAGAKKLDSPQDAPVTQAKNNTADLAAGGV